MCHVEHVGSCVRVWVCAGMCKLVRWFRPYRHGDPQSGARLLPLVQAPHPRCPCHPHRYLPPPPWLDDTPSESCPARHHHMLHLHQPAPAAAAVVLVAAVAVAAAVAVVVTSAEGTCACGRRNCLRHPWPRPCGRRWFTRHHTSCRNSGSCASPCPAGLHAQAASCRWTRPLLRRTWMVLEACAVAWPRQHIPLPPRVLRLRRVTVLVTTAMQDRAPCRRHMIASSSVMRACMVSTMPTQPRRHTYTSTGGAVDSSGCGRDCTMTTQL